MLALVVVTAGAGVHAADLLDRVLAVVSGTVITLSDVRAVTELGLVDVRGARDPVAAALTWLIEHTLVLDEALRDEPAEPDARSIEAAVLDARRRFTSDEAWRRALERSGRTDADVRALMRDVLHVRLYTERRFEGQSPATDADLRAYYARHIAVFTRDGKPAAFESVGDEVASLVRRERRDTARSEWVARLRRRAEISELYVPLR